MGVEGNTAVVIDCGSGFCKAGIASWTVPFSEVGDTTVTLSVFPSIVGRRRIQGPGGPSWSIGVKSHPGMILKNCIERGLVTNWDGMEKIWNHIFYEELKVDTGQHPVLLTEDLRNPKSDREKMTQIMFEQMGVPALYIAPQTVLSLFASGRTTGTVLESGYETTHSVCVYEECAMPHTIQSTDLAGCDITDYFARILTERGHYFTTKAELVSVTDIKEKLCYVALDFEEAVAVANSSPSEDYELPDGRHVSIRDAKYRCPEPLFKPSIMGMKTCGIHECLNNSIMKSDENIRKDLISNIVFAGGNTKFPGFAERFHREVASLVSSDIANSINVISPPSRELTAWIGGSMIASLSIFQKMCISKKEYDEAGPAIVHRKCF